MKRYPQVKLFADGGSRGNPGPSASGSLITDPDDNKISERGVYLGITTNNQAEYQGLLTGLELAKKVGAKRVDCYLDSNLIVNQMKGRFRVKNQGLKPLYEQAKKLAGTFDRITFTHVYREYNGLADKIVNDVLDAHAKKIKQKSRL
jgi:ribonuclease HI